MKRVGFVLLLIATCLFAEAQHKPEGLFIHSKAPEFKAKDQNGNEISLRDLRKKGPVVIVFYRGYWCPYCNRELTRLQDSLQLILDKGAALVAITPEDKEGISKTMEKTGATFPIIHDEELKIMKAYDVDFTVDERTLGRYKNAGIDLEANNGAKNGANLPVPAVYVVDKTGEIVYRYFDENYRRRPSVREILKNL